MQYAYNTVTDLKYVSCSDRLVIVFKYQSSR